jgi:hypothetical protein
VISFGSTTSHWTAAGTSCTATNQTTATVATGMPAAFTGAMNRRLVAAPSCQRRATANSNQNSESYSGSVNR